MDCLPTLNVIEQSQVSPPPATIGPKSLPLTFLDMEWLTLHPLHILFFYQLPITKTHFTETTLPNLKQSLSITLQHFFPFVGKLSIFPSTTRPPEIRYVEGDSVAVTFAESSLDFHYLTGNHPRECDKFYHLIPLLGDTTKVSGYITIPVFAVQVTLFPNFGVSIGITTHHSLGDASTIFCFLKAWASISQSSGSDETFLANGTLPIYDRLIKYPKLDEIYLNKAKINEAFIEEYKLPRLSGPTDKVRATFILTRSVINGFKKLVSTQRPTSTHVTSFSVAYAYIIGSRVANLHNNELMLFAFAVDCRSRLDPPVPSAYFGNCIMPCLNFARTSTLQGKEGFLRAAKLIGENLHKMLADKDGLLKEFPTSETLFPEGQPRKFMSIAGTPKLNFYELDFGFGKPIKHEWVSTDYYEALSLSPCRESNEDLEIGMCLSVSEMDAFISSFNYGLESYI